MSEPHDRLEQRLTSARFVVEPTVTKRTALLVAADPASLSGKARKARAYDIPIVGEHAAAALTRTR
jgi:DNA polymerase-3 subunit epsilon